VQGEQNGASEGPPQDERGIWEYCLACGLICANSDLGAPEQVVTTQVTAGRVLGKGQILIPLPAVTLLPLPGWLLGSSTHLHLPYALPQPTQVACWSSLPL
jgi:hypothetical protein